MYSIHELLRTRIVTLPDPYLIVWWNFMNYNDKMKVQKHIGYLPSLLEMKAWPGLIGRMVKFWDAKIWYFSSGKLK